MDLSLSGWNSEGRNMSEGALAFEIARARSERLLPAS